MATEVDAAAIQHICASHWFAVEQTTALSHGRINDTFVVVSASNGRRFVLQRLNSQVFVPAERCMEQTQRVVRHLNGQHSGWVPQLVPNLDGQYYSRIETTAAAVDLWRLWTYVENAQTLDPLPNADALYNAGAAFGHTHRLLQGLPGAPLEDPIPGLFDLASHYARCEHLLASDTLAQRSVADCVLLDQCVQVFESFRTLQTELGERTSIIHGDCKPKNLMFSASGSEVASVLDLDTVMQGHWAWDYGDLVRSAALADGAFSSERFEPLLRGFIESSPRDHVHDADILLHAPVHIACCLGVRYLVDYLDGNRFFKVRKPNDNLIRAAARFGLAQQIQSQATAMQPVISRSLS